MTDNKLIHRILKYDLCLGCGLCSSVYGHERCEMKLDDNGFYRPMFKKTVSENILRYLCPGIRVHSVRHNSIWGNVVKIVEGWSRDTELRHKAASGGVVSSLAIYFLETQKVDAVLQVGVRNDSYLLNELKVSRSREDILANAQSRYAPALSLVNIKQLLDTTSDRYLFIGKPCDIAGVKNLIELNPSYEKRFVLFISIFCAGMPSYHATERAWRMSGRTDTPISLKYRGDGWPGSFRAIWSDGGKFELSYDESWGKILGKQLGFRCKICPDGIGMLADISIGDSWNTSDGYPDFTEDEGRCFVFVRTERALLSIEAASKKGFIEYRGLPIDRIQEMQAYQFNRRKLVGWRLFPVWVATGGIISFKGLSIIRQARTASVKQGLKNMIGTIKRMIKVFLK